MLHHIPQICADLLFRRPSQFPILAVGDLALLLDMLEVVGYTSTAAVRQLATLIEGLPDADGSLSSALDEYDMADGETLGGFLK